MTGVDLDRLVAGSSRVQVGVASVEPLEGFVVEDAVYSTSGTVEEVRVEITDAGGGQCTVTSAYVGEAATDQLIEETLQNDGEPTRWARDEVGGTWQTTVTMADVFTVECEQPDVAEALARSASFGL